MLAAVTELAARWHRAHAGLQADEFTRGRMGGYEQAIALLLDVPIGNVRVTLLEGNL